MVHKKYIKRGNKVFGPYLYENYRENGVMRTRYLGLGKSRKRVINLQNFLVVSIIFLLVLVLLSSAGFLVSNDQEALNELASGNPLNAFKVLFGAGSPLNVFVQILGNRPPVIYDLDSEIYVCENDYLSEFFYVMDNDTMAGVDVELSPIEPFYLIHVSNITENISEYEIYSDPIELLNKSHVNEERYTDGVFDYNWAVFPEQISADDQEIEVIFNFDIILMEINNPPLINTAGVITLDVENVTEATLWARWPRNNIYYSADGRDLETPSEFLNYGLIIEGPNTTLFNISSEGIINFSAHQGHLLCGTNCSDNYNITVYVNDTRLPRPHEEIDMCLPQISESESNQTEFRITITDKNTAPNITSNYPLNNITRNVSGTESLYFNITYEDEQSPFPDAYWYVYPELKLIKFQQNNLTSELDYSFGCGVSGNHIIKAVVTDGELNDSVSWNFSVKNVECPAEPPSGGGGGGGSKIYCKEKWTCNDWDQCQNLKELSEQGWVSEESNLLIQERCNIFNYTGEFCGFQQRICRDFNVCKTENEIPPVLRECYYTENPTCEDGIRNCHDGGCELSIDCGGPCEFCPSCNDGIQNQNEERIDCGGPCKACLELPWLPPLFKNIITYSLILLFILVLLLVVRQVSKYVKASEIFKKLSIKNRIIRDEKKPNKKLGGKQEKRNVIVSLFFVGFIIALLFFSNIYIMNSGLKGGIPGLDDVGFLASYSFINSFVRNIGLFVASLPIVSDDGRTELVVGDDTDSIHKKGGEDVYFYGDYNYVSGGVIPSPPGFCQIRFENYTGSYSDWFLMNYEGGLRYGYTKIGGFNYKNDWSFEVNCSENGINGTVNQTDVFTIDNTEPIFIPASVTTYFGIEDILLTHDFSQNVTEPDVNDVITYTLFSINDEDPINYPWISLNSSSGIFIINSTISSESQDFDITIDIIDTDGDGESRTFFFNINESNDPPQFNSLQNQTLIVDDSFEYIINISDEEDNFPFVFTIENNSLIDSGEYNQDSVNGILNISFTPDSGDIGSYVINISIMDNSSLGNQTTSQLVEFNVIERMWEDLELNHLINEGDEFYLNLSENVTRAGINFYNLTSFPYFSLTSDGIINFTPDDAAVWENLIEIFANDTAGYSGKLFNFTVLNVNDVPGFKALDLDCDSGDCDYIANVVEAYENELTKITIQIEDKDFLIPNSTEILTISTDLQGVNNSLFVFSSTEGGKDDFKNFKAEFFPMNTSVGDYNVSFNFTDSFGAEGIFTFNLTIYSRNYSAPNITYPGDVEFNLVEGNEYNLTFKANHTVQDDLNFSFYVKNVLRESFEGSGDDSNFTWLFTPNYDDETYGNKTNLTLIVSNLYFSTEKTWNLTVNHSNAPVVFNGEITDKGPITYPHEFGIDLLDYFYDADYYDIYNSTPEGQLEFEVYSSSNNSKITTREDNVDGLWVYIGAFAETTEVLNISVNDNSSVAFSNNFTVSFIPPSVVTQPVPSSGSTTTIPIALKIITPGEISAFEGDIINVPIQLINSGKKDFKDLTLNSSAFKEGIITDELKTSLDVSYFKKLKPKEERNLTLTLEMPENKIGKYEILINAVSKSPKYTDWGKIYIDLQPINESQVRELILFTEEFIASNPQCIEITELIKEAEDYLSSGDYLGAREKSQEALEGCKQSISQASTPRLRVPDFVRSLKFSLYLSAAILFAIILGLAYYLWRRNKIKNLQKSINQNKTNVNENINT